MPSEFINNENRARLRDSINKPSDRSAYGGIGERPMGDPGRPLGGAVGNEMPPGILNGNSVPMTLDSHAGSRRSNDNLTVKPGEKPRSHYTAENRRRLAGGGDTYK